MKTILLTFENESQRDEYLKLMRIAAANMVTVEDQANTKLFVDALDNVRFDPPIKPDSERPTALYVAGQKMLEGSLADLNVRFDQEITQHSGTVQIREQRGDQWHIIRQRLLQ